MKIILDFFRLRKQYDSIKFAFSLFICAVYFLVYGTIQIVSYTNYLNKPCEYILEAYSDSASLETALQKICEIKGTVSASFQHDYIISTDDNNTLAISELSAEYLSKCYGVEISMNSKKVWLNSVAFDKIIGESGSDSVRVSYTIDGKKESAEFIRWESLDSETAYAVSIGTSVFLENSRTVRVMFDSIDVTGTNIRQIENWGYTVLNRENIILQFHKQELLFEKIKFCISGMVLSLIGGYGFVKIYNCNKKR